LRSEDDMTLVRTVSLLLIGASAALAAPIVIVNGSFEQAPAGGALSAGGQGAFGDVPGWGTCGSLPAEAYPTSGIVAHDGLQAAYMGHDSCLTQNTPYLWTAGTTYSYTAWVGLATGSQPLPFVLEFYAGGSSLVAFTVVDPSQLVSGGWLQWSLSAALAPGDPRLFSTVYLQIGVSNAGDLGTPTDHMYLDQVGLDSSAVSSATPEPEGLLPIGLAGLVMLRSWRRRRAR